MADDTNTKDRIFISWSGDLARAVGHHLEEFFPTVIHALDPWMSDSDISQGSFWHQEIIKGLHGARVGVVVLTPDNVFKPWLHYEVGYLTRFIDADEGLVSPILIGTTTAQIQGPMTSHQSTLFERGPMLKLVKDINKKIGEPTTVAALDQIFPLLWPDLEAKVNASIEAHRPKLAQKKPFDDQRVLTEILETVRSIGRRDKNDDVLQSLNQIRLEMATLSGSYRTLSADERENMIQHYEDIERERTEGIFERNLVLAGSMAKEMGGEVVDGHHNMSGGLSEVYVAGPKDFPLAEYRTQLSSRLGRKMKVLFAAEPEPTDGSELI